MLEDLASPVVTIAALGMIESLLCGASASRMKGEAFNADQELIAQGVGNILLPLFGGVPATAAIARTSVAVKSGQQTRLTSVFHSLFLLASMFLLGGVMALLPLSALAGVLIVTAWRMNDWEGIRDIFRHKFKSGISQFLITILTWRHDHWILLGVVCSAIRTAASYPPISTQQARSVRGKSGPPAWRTSRARSSSARWMSSTTAWRRCRSTTTSSCRCAVCMDNGRLDLRCWTFQARRRYLELRSVEGAHSVTSGVRTRRARAARWMSSLDRMAVPQCFILSMRGMPSVDVSGAQLLGEESLFRISR